jgi:peptidoglycan hydrolase-like protein with peptidoglycan-binding domain
MIGGSLHGQAPHRPARFAVALLAVGSITVSLAGCAGDVRPAPDAATAPTAGMTTDPSVTATPPAQAPPGATAAPGHADPSAVLRLGDTGPAVMALQQRLTELGYWLGRVDGTYGQLTRQAVMAFQKAEDVMRDGVAGPQTRRLLPTASRPTSRSTAGDLIEVDLERQLLLVVRGGQVHWAFNTSTGNGETYARPSGGTGVARTPRGDFRVERQINGLRRAELGLLYRPKYFRGGIAIHGSGSIPARPASHGCVRVTNAAMDILWAGDLAAIGTRVVVY